MAAHKNTVNQESSLYIHVLRKVDEEIIFVDNKDYEIFIDFLKDYFSDTNNLEKARKSFTVRGRTYQGVPHKPQNFFDKIELLAYKLEPNQIDFLIKQIVPGTLEKFIRAISTRYAIYFNKKYNRSGTLFRDPYRLHQIKDFPSLLYLTRDFHCNFSDKDGVPAHYYSSYPEYLGQRESKWIKSQDVLSLEGSNDYKSFVENSKPEHIKGKDNIPHKPLSRIPEIILATTILILLSSYSVIKIETFIPRLISPIATVPPQVAGINYLETEATQTQTLINPEAKTILVIKITDGSTSTNLYKEPSSESQIISQAKDGESFELVAIHPKWNEIKLADNQNVFVLAKNTQIIKEDNRQ